MVARKQWMQMGSRKYRRFIVMAICQFAFVCRMLGMGAPCAPLLSTYFCLFCDSNNASLDINVIPLKYFYLCYTLRIQNSQVPPNLHSEVPQLWHYLSVMILCHGNTLKIAGCLAISLASQLDVTSRTPHPRPVVDNNILPTMHIQKFLELLSTS